MRYAALHYQDTGEAVKLCHMTLKRLAAGGNTRKKANAERAWLNDAEVNVVIEFINEMAAHGFLISHTRLKEAVDLICGARLGKEFPVMGVGKNWTYRFSKKYADCIKISRSRALEDKRGCAANPSNDEAWWKMLGEIIEKYMIKPKNIYRSDEVSIQAQGQGECEFVFSPRTKAAPYQQHSGLHESITVIVTICADGSTTPPAVIFKGSAYNVKWGDNNPLNALYMFSYFSLYLI